MKHILHRENIYKQYRTAILVKDNAFNKTLIEQHYVAPLGLMGIDPMDLISFNLKYNDLGKAPVKLIRAHLDNVLRALQSQNVTTILCNDSAYFKTLTGHRKAEPYHGYVQPCNIAGYAHISVILGVNYGALFHNPLLQDKITMSLKTVARHMQGTHKDLGVDIIHSEYYPSTADDILAVLQKLHKYPVLTCDIETNGLELDVAGIATISFAWDQHNGVAFGVEYHKYTLKPKQVMSALKAFFETYTGKLIYHGSSFDIKHLIFNLFMDQPLDTKGLLEGLEVMYRNIEDTKIITYLATNTTSGNNLSLKANAFEFAGNYAQDDIDDIFSIPLSEVLRYNLTDCLATWYVYNKNYPRMVLDKQEEIYDSIMLPSLKVICQMELTGMPLDMFAVEHAEKVLKSDLQQYVNNMQSLPTMAHFEKVLQMHALLTKQATLKVKKVHIADFKDVHFNPGSNQQTAKLLHEHFNLKVVDTTDTGLPAVGAKTLKKHLNQLIKEHSITEDELK